MIQFFRNFFQSKIGIVVTFVFLALIALAFASSDVASTGTFGGVSGGDRVAVVGDEKIGTADLSRAASSAVEQLRQQDPTVSMPAFLERDGLKEVLDQLTERSAITGFAAKYGLRAGANLVNSEIMALPAFRGPNGNFDQTTYEQAIRQRGLSDAMVRKDFAAGLTAQQVLVPAAFGARVPEAAVTRYASLLKETRSGSIAFIPSQLYAPQGKPSDAQLRAYYDKAKGDFILPERREIRYITFDDSAIDDDITPSAKEIADRFQRDRETYAPSEKRTLSQLIVPTRQAADAIRNKVLAGGSLETSAREAGLQVSAIANVDKQAFAGRSSAAVANAAFAGKSGSIAAIARSGLGFHVVRIDRITAEPGRTLAQATPEITATLREEKRRTALTDLAARLEEELEGGVSMTELAAELKSKLEASGPITGNGLLYGKPQERAPAVLAPALQTAFQMEEGEPQLAEVVPGQTFLVFEVNRVTPSAAPPLAEIRDAVAARWAIAEGAKAARLAADRILKQIGQGKTIAAAIAAEGKPLPAPEAINMNRVQLAAAPGGVLPPLALLFSMAERTTKRLEAPRDGGWYVVRLDDITVGTLAKDDPLIEQTRRELAQLTGREYGDQLRSAIRKEIGIEINDTAVAAVRKQLAGEN